MIMVAAISPAAILVSLDGDTPVNIRPSVPAGQGGPQRRPASVLRECIVRIAVEPLFTGLRGRNHRMPAGVRMLRGVLVGGVVAAQRAAAFLAREQMHPAGTDFDALLAFVPLRMFHGGHCRDVRAG